MPYDDPCVINVRMAGDPRCWTDTSGKERV
jgi:hypothetical protein